MSTPLTIYDILKDVTTENPSPAGALIVAGSGGGAIIVAPGTGPQGKTWDYLAVTYPSGTQEVYTFKTGGSGGSTVATATIDYVDSTKAQLLDVAWT